MRRGPPIAAARRRLAHAAPTSPAATPPAPSRPSVARLPQNGEANDVTIEGGHPLQMSRTRRPTAPTRIGVRLASSCSRIIGRHRGTPRRARQGPAGGAPAGDFQQHKRNAPGPCPEGVRVPQAKSCEKDYLAMQVAAVCGRADVEAGIGRIGGASSPSFRSRSRKPHRLVAHLERPLADLARRQALLHQLHLHRQRVGDDQRQRSCRRSAPCASRPPCV